jgi:hypothetical protein
MIIRHLAHLLPCLDPKIQTENKNQLRFPLRAIESSSCGDWINADGKAAASSRRLWVHLPVLLQ